MRNGTFDYTYDVKQLTEEGEFEGYASTFGNVDLVGDKIVAGAFVESLSDHHKANTRPLMLWHHKLDVPIGVWTDVAEDKKGLYAKGHLLKGIRQAEEAHILMKNRAIRGLSIGFRVKEAEPDGNVMVIKKAQLIEMSLVSLPANPKARVTRVKSEQELGERLRDICAYARDGEPRAIKEFEELLRDAGLAKSMATIWASKGYAEIFRSESGEEEAVNRLAAKMQQALSGFTRG